MSTRYVVCFLTLVTWLAIDGMPKREFSNVNYGRGNEPVVAIFQGNSSLLHKEPSRFSELATKKNEDMSYRELQRLVPLFQPFTNLQGNYDFQIVDNGKLYHCQSPIISSVSQYVAHYDRFLDKVKSDGLEAFGFTGPLATENQCPFVSFTTSPRTARKYSTAEAEPAFRNFNGFPYYENGKPSEAKIGSIMVAFPSTNIINDNNEFLYVDVKNERRLCLGQTQERRLAQDEICVIGGLPSTVECKVVDINMPDFSRDWKFDGIDEEQRKVNKDGLTKREFASWSRKIENADDKTGAWRAIYEGLMNKRKHADTSVSYIVNKELSGHNLSTGDNIFPSIFH